MKNRIYQLMKQQGMTQKEFAAELCVAEGTLSSIYTGRTKASNNIVNAIHERFPDVSVLWLMYGEGEMYGSEKATLSSEQPTDLGGDVQNAVLKPSGAVQPLSEQSPVTPAAPVVQEVIKYVEKPQRKISEIRIFYDDGTFETFSAGSVSK